METGAFGWKFQDQIQPLLDAHDRQIDDIRLNGMEGQLARMQAMNDADGAGDRANGASAALAAGAKQQDGSWYNLVGDGNTGGITPGVDFGMNDLTQSPSTNLSLSSGGQGGSSAYTQVSALANNASTFHDIAGYLTSPEVTNFLRQQGGYINKAGDIVGLGGMGLAVAGSVVGQPEIGLPVVGLGAGLNLLGNGAIVLSDVLANNRDRAVKDAIGAGVGSVLPPMIDPQPLIDRTGKYFGH